MGEGAMSGASLLTGAFLIFLAAVAGIILIAAPPRGFRPILIVSLVLAGLGSIMTIASFWLAAAGL